MMNDQDKDIKQQTIASLLPDLFQEPSSSAPTETAHPEQPVESSGGDLNLPPPADDDIIYDDNFSYDGFQVVRGEYFYHRNEPCITISDFKLTFNASCLRKVPNVDFVMVLINPDTKMMVIRPASDDVKDSFIWKTASNKPKSITCRIFYAKILELMEWDSECRYKLIGKLVKRQDEYLFVFDLKAYEAYQRSITVTPEGKEKRTTSRKPLYPEEWKNQFGLPVDEHRKRLHLNIYDGYAVFGLKEAAQQPIPTPLSRNATTTSTIPGGVIDAASDNSVSNPRLP